MKRFIKRLQKQPQEVKSHAAFIGAVCVTGLIALIWVSTLPARFSQIATMKVRENVAALSEGVKSQLPAKLEEIKPISEEEKLRNRVDELVKNVRDKRLEGGVHASSTETRGGTMNVSATSSLSTTSTSSTAATTVPIRIEVR